MNDDEFLAKVKLEYKRARTLFPPFKSGHEGYAVILEELDELWDSIKGVHNSNSTESGMTTECIQIAAMAMAFHLDLLQGSLSTEDQTTLRSEK